MRVGVLCALLAGGAVAPAAAAPTISAVTLSATSIQPGETVTVSVTLTQASAWRVDVLPMCGGPALRSITGYAPIPQWSVPWDGRDSATALAPAGAYRVRVTLTDAVGAATATAVERELTIAGDAGGVVCPNVRLLPSTDVYAQGLAALKASDAASVVIGSARDAGYAAIASSYAHRYAVPLLLLTPDALHPTRLASLAKLLANRGTKAVIIGNTEAVPIAVDTAMRARKVRLVRLAGSERAATAALIAARIKPQPGSGAVYVSLGGTPALVAVASAYANALGLPLLGASRQLSRFTTDAVTALQIKGGVAIGDSRDIGDDVIAGLAGVTRVIGKDLASTSFILARALPVGAAQLVVDAAARPDATTLIWQARLGEPQLLLNAGELSTALRAWLTARQELIAATVTTRIDRVQATALGRLIADRGAVGALPALEPQPALPVTVPASFTFSGSGFGHGVGMSQWGAYGMAKEGFSAAAILEHYFTGSTVAPIKDDVELNVSIDSRVSSESFRLEKLADPTSTLEMTAADGTVTLLAVGDVVKTTYTGGKIAVSVTGTTPVAPFTTNALTLKWAGNRDSGTATGGPAVLRVAGPGASIGNGSRYRYGIMSITVSKLSGALALGLQVNNILRLHDEYLYGIAEVGSSWPAATLQAQVITARSYAFKKYKAGLRSACACHIYDDPRDQNFTGYAKLAEKSGNIDYGAKWKAAVDGTAVSATQGQALTVGGSVVSAYYSAATGGATQNNEDVWGGSPLAYTRSVPDPWSLTYASSSVSRWRPRSFSQATVAAAFGAPDVAYLDLSHRYASGAVDTITAISSNGQRFVLGAETFKSRLNRGLADAAVLAQGIPSVWLWRVDTEVPTSSAAAAATQVAAGTTSIAAGLPAATATTIVLVQASTDTATLSPVLTLAAAYAGAQRAALLVNTSANALDAVIKAELQRRKATRVLLVGPVPAGLVSGVAKLGIASTTANAGTPAALSAQLATLAARPVGTPAVVASSVDVRAAALAVSLATRTRRPLLFIDGGVMSGEVSAYVMAAQPAAITVVGAADVVPDAAVAGIGAVSRLTTGDLVLASVIAASQAPDTATVGIVVANALAPASSSVIAAASGLPLFYATDALPGEALALVPRLPTLTLVLRVGVDAAVIERLRRA